MGELQSLGVSRSTTVVEVIDSMFLALVLFFFVLGVGVVLLLREGRAVHVGVGRFALVEIGVPLVIPLTVLTFFAAFFPIIGATVAGALAAMVALVTLGPREAIIIAAATLVIQQVEGLILYLDRPDELAR